MVQVYDPSLMLRDGEKLDADGIVELFEIVCPNAYAIYTKQNDTVTFQGKTYEGGAVQLSGVSKRGDGENSRPTLVIANPLGIYNTFAALGFFEFAAVNRIRVLREHLLQDTDIKSVNTWNIYQVSQCDDQTITFSLRCMTDKFNTTIPGRMFIPPVFPMVTLE